jgi:Fungal specific transcription factor domain/Fungal Zn(2)-Cys(6) binuclear cluster domain
MTPISPQVHQARIGWYEPDHLYSLTCRKRHMKCDEAKPACGQCTRTQKSCVYGNGPSEQSQTPTPRSHSRAFSRETASLNDSVAASSTASSGQHHLQSQAGQVAEVENDRNVPVEPSSSGTQDIEMTASTFNYTSPASIETNSAYQPIGIATARWFGMLAGDAELEIGPPPQQDADLSDLYRTKSPYELCGINSGPIDQSQPSLRPANEYAASDPLQERYTGAHEERVLIEKLSWQTQTALPLRGQEHRLFDTFVQHISLWLDLFDPQQNFASLVPRLALYNVGLLNAILTLSVRYYSLRAKTMDELSLAREDALPYYHETLHYVRKAMQYESYHTSDELLATTIIISAYEMLDGSSRDWERHLQGVFWIQRSQVIHGDSGGLRAAIWWIWLCQDAWAAFRDRRKVFTFWKPQRSLSELGPSELAARSVFILGRVINYCALGPVGDSLNGISEKMRQADILSSLLDEWEGLLTPHFTPLPHHDLATNSVFAPIWVYPPMYGMCIPSCCVITLSDPAQVCLFKYITQHEFSSSCTNRAWAASTNL